MSRRMLAMLLAVAVSLIAAANASAATLTVDDDGSECPGAGYTKIQHAIDDAVNGDTVAICPGTYVEGIGATGTNALTISNKSINLAGAGADLVAIQPKRTTPTTGRIADSALNIRNGVGDIISVIGTKALPVTVNISGVSVDGNGVYVEAGVVYRDGGGTISRSRVTNIVTSESNTAESLEGGYRSNFPGIGIAQVTAGTGTPAATRPPLNVVQSRISRYNRYGVLIDSATGDTPPLTGTTVTNQANLVGNQIIGRTQCSAFNTPTPPPYVLGGPDATPALQLPGNCATISPTTVGTTFGQDGVRVTAGSTVSITDNTIAANLVHGTAAPAFNSATNNANLPLGAGVRLIGAGASTVANSNIVDNAYGIYNVGLNGTTANTTTPVSAENNYWGLRTNASSNPGPVVSPTTNPPYQENPVNGTATADASCVASTGLPVPGSDAVDFCPFRNGNQADPNSGEYPVPYAPLPVSDAGPTISLDTDSPTYERGDVVTMTAGASDDFGIAKVTFYDGADVVGVAVPPDETAQFTIPATAACADRTLTAVAEDSIGQTASDATTITVDGPNNCEPPTPVPDEPTIALTGVPATIGAGGATIEADVTVDPTLTAGPVVFMLGARTVCTDGAAPYSCKVLPTGAEVGAQSVTATVTDSGGESATDTAATEVERFVPRALTLTVDRIKPKNAGAAKKGKSKKKGKLIRKLTGEVLLPPRVSQAQGCATGTVTLNLTLNANTLFPYTQLPLRRDCTYALRFAVKKTKKHIFNAEVAFSGNSVLTQASNDRRFK